MPKTGLAVAILIALIFSACTKAKVNESKSFLASSSPIRYLDSIFSSSDSLVNQVYRVAKDYKGQNDSLKYDYYGPHGDTSRARPFIIFINGGAFSVLNRKEMDSLCKQYNKYGYATATIDYRIGFNDLNAPGASPSDFYGAIYRAIQDVRAFIRFAKTNYVWAKIDTT